MKSAALLAAAAAAFLFTGAAEAMPVAPAGPSRAPVIDVVTTVTKTVRHGPFGARIVKKRVVHHGRFGGRRVTTTRTVR